MKKKKKIHLNLYRMKIITFSAGLVIQGAHGHPGGQHHRPGKLRRVRGTEKLGDSRSPLHVCGQSHDR